MSARNCSASPLLHAEALDERPRRPPAVTGSDTLVDLRGAPAPGLPASCGTRQSAGNSTSICFSSSPLDMPTSAVLDLRQTSRPSRSRWRRARRLRPAARSSPACDQVSSSTASPSLGGALDRAPGAALQAQVLDHRVDVGVGDFGGVADHAELGDVDVAEIRHHFEGGDVGQLVLAPAGSMLRIAGQLQRLLAHGLRRSSRAAGRRGPRRGPARRSAARSPWPAPCRGGSP